MNPDTKPVKKASVMFDTRYGKESKSDPRRRHGATVREDRKRDRENPSQIVDIPKLFGYCFRQKLKSTVCAH